MITQTFGPPHEAFEGLIDKIDARGDHILAQSVYDTRTSDMFASASIVIDSADDLDRPEELLAAQHIILNGGEIEGRGLLIDHSDQRNLIRFLGIFLKEVASTVPPLDEDHLDTSFFHDARTNTLATVEVTRGLSGGYLAFIGYPKFIATGDIAASTLPTGDLTHRQRELGLGFAKMAISRAWHNTNRTGH